MKKFAVLSALALVSMLALSGCAPASDTSEPVAVGSEQGTLRWYSVELPEKQAVDCVASQYTANVTDPDCNWSIESNR